MTEEYIGVDLHKAFFQACAVTPGDRVWEGRFARSREGVARFVAHGVGETHAIAVEAQRADVGVRRCPAADRRAHCGGRSAEDPADSGRRREDGPAGRAASASKPRAEMTAGETIRNGAAGVCGRGSEARLTWTRYMSDSPRRSRVSGARYNPHRRCPSLPELVSASTKFLIRLAPAAWARSTRRATPPLNETSR